jgi:hypothetical protein
MHPNAPGNSAPPPPKKKPSDTGQIESTCYHFI